MLMLATFCEVCSLRPLRRSLRRRLQHDVGAAFLDNDAALLQQTDLPLDDASVGLTGDPLAQNLDLDMDGVADEQWILEGPILEPERADHWFLEIEQMRLHAKRQGNAQAAVHQPLPERR